jgi:hypothetical protein
VYEFPRYTKAPDKRFVFLKKEKISGKGKIERIAKQGTKGK